MGILAVRFFLIFQSTCSMAAPQWNGGGWGRELGLRTSKVDISERMSRTSRAAWRFVFGSVMLDWGMAVAVCGSVFVVTGVSSAREDPDILFAVLSHDCVAHKLSKFAGMPALVRAFSPSYIYSIHR